jgi:glycosyltransferase involved in cell wall biosynthesis
MEKNIKTPRVTVLMSVYNSEKYLKRAIGSILNQTFKDFEFLIINDGSKDSSLKIVKSYKDPRIRLISHENRGLTSCLNEGISEARGEFIARQDDDDESVPTRLEKEVEYLDSHSDVGMVGSNYTAMDSNTWKPVVTTNIFTHPIDLRLALITCNQYGHGSVLMRTKLVRKLKGYDPQVGCVEDYDLWTRMSQVSNVANIEEPLYLYCRNDKGITRQNLELQIKQTFAVRDKAFKYFLKHRNLYRFLFYKPSGTDYRKRKATLYRDLAYLFRTNNMPIRSLLVISLSILLEPSNKKNYRCIKYILRKKYLERWEYEFL